MNNELRNALDKVQAIDALKNDTARFLREKINGHRRKQVSLRFRFATVSAIMVLLVFIGGFSYNLYFTPNAYVDMDVNPSIGLTLNSFGRVIDLQAYNDDGAAVLADVNVRFKPYDEAASVLLDAVITEGYLAEDGLVSVTVQASGDLENDMLTGLNQIVTTSLNGHHLNAQTDIYAVTDEVRTNAQEHHVTPAMYLAITELQEVDPAVTFEGCMGHSIHELRKLTQEHGGGHHGQGRGTNNTESKPDVSPEVPSYGQTGGHHGDRRNGHD